MGFGRAINPVCNGSVGTRVNPRFARIWFSGLDMEFNWYAYSLGIRQLGESLLCVRTRAGTIPVQHHMKEMCWPRMLNLPGTVGCKLRGNLALYCLSTNEE